MRRRIDRDMVLEFGYGWEGHVSRVRVSPKYQVVIPRDVLESMGIAPGEELDVHQSGERIELVRVRSVREMRGMLKGIDTTVEREDEDRV